jgi:hypothetical protein
MDSLPRLSASIHYYNQNQKQHSMPNLQSSKLKKDKWMDLLTNDRHRILGQVIDGMIYNYECVNEVREMLSRWDDEGFLRSIILPDEEPDNMCNSCNGTGEGCNPDVSCLSCKGSGAIIPKTYDYED